jgi:hypothetical protein
VVATFRRGRVVLHRGAAVGAALDARGDHLLEIVGKRPNQFVLGPTRAFIEEIRISAGNPMAKR